MARKGDLTMDSIKLAPSILAADFARLGDQVREAEQAGADRIHIDVMDGHFVPNISMGPVVVQSLRPVTRLPLEVHLMIEEPDRYLDAFAEAGADSLLVHAECAVHLHRTIQHVKHLGKKAGVVLNPASSPVLLAEVLIDVDLVLAMTVNPGFGGQAFIPSTLDKIRRLRQMIDQIRPGVELEVDGGIDAATAPQAVQAGARVLVAGSAIFRAPDGIAAAQREEAAGHSERTSSTSSRVRSGSSVAPRAPPAQAAPRTANQSGRSGPSSSTSHSRSPPASATRTPASWQEDISAAASRSGSQSSSDVPSL
jgi:ribulose-phosphate 3-epimerase